MPRLVHERSQRVEGAARADGGGGPGRGGGGVMPDPGPPAGKKYVQGRKTREGRNIFRRRTCSLSCSWTKGSFLAWLIS